MTRVELFIARCDAAAERLGITRSALSSRLLADSRRLDLIAAGKDIGVRRMERAEGDLAAMEGVAHEGAA